MSEENDSDNSWMEDGAEYSPKSEFSKPRVIEDGTRKCFELRSKEMRRGYYNTKFTKEGLPLKIWIEDSRKAYCSAVIALKHLLSPEILQDKEKYKTGDKKKDEDEEDDKKKVKIKTAYKHIKLGHLLSKYAYYKLEKQIIDGKNKYIKTNEYYMPDMDEAVFIREIFPDGNEQIKRIEGKWNQSVNAYWDHMVKRCDLLFEQLMQVIHRLNYFKQSIRYG